MEQLGEIIESRPSQRIHRPETFLEESEVANLRRQLAARQSSWEQGQGIEVREIEFADLKNPEDLLFLKGFFEHSLSESEIKEYYQKNENGPAYSSQLSLCALARNQFMNDFSERKRQERLNRQRAA